MTAELTTNAPKPDLVVVQSSPLHGTEPPGEDAVLLEDYDRRLAMVVAEPDEANVYDGQDDFYLPMSGFTRIERPGPNLRIYVRHGIEAR